MRKITNSGQRGDARDTVSNDDELNAVVAGLMTKALVPADLLAEERQPETLGRFRILGQLGRGGMGTVFRARDETLGREVALKQLSVATGSASLLERLSREARAMARLEHPGIVSLLDVASTDDGPVLVMELVEGPTLGAALADGLDRAAALRACAEVADALAHVHARGLVHRDVKPSNVLLAPDGRARLTDFGLVFDAEVTRLTRSDGFVGTPAYTAPEQIEGAPGPAADVYSLGATIYEACAGEPPFADTTVLGLLSAVANRTPVPLGERAQGVPRPVAALVEACLDKDPQRRPSAADVARCLRTGAAPPRARPGGRSAARLAAFALLGLGGALGLSLAVASQPEGARGSSRAATSTLQRAPCRG